MQIQGDDAAAGTGIKKNFFFDMEHITLYGTKKMQIQGDDAAAGTGGWHACTAGVRCWAGLFVGYKYLINI